MKFTILVQTPEEWVFSIPKGKKVGETAPATIDKTRVWGKILVASKQTGLFPFAKWGYRGLESYNQFALPGRFF